jgi:hypothetical protein
MFLDKITGPFGFPRSALHLRIKLYIKAEGAALNLSDDELWLFFAFNQKFTHPKLVTVEWYNQHGVDNRSQSYLKYDIDIADLRVQLEQTLKGVKSVKKMQFESRKAWELLEGRWTENQNEHHLEVMEETIKARARMRLWKGKEPPSRLRRDGNRMEWWQGLETSSFRGVSTNCFGPWDR